MDRSLEPALKSKSRRATSVSARALAGPLPPRPDPAGGATLYPSVGGSLYLCTRVLWSDSAERVPNHVEAGGRHRTGSWQDQRRAAAWPPSEPFSRRMGLRREIDFLVFEGGF